MESKPKHIAIIMDGNGRWAELNKVSRSKGHKAGVDALEKVIKAAMTHRIEWLSVFAFSTENWRRSAKEVSFLMSLFLSGLKNQAKKFHEQNIRLRFVGDRTRLAKKLQKEIARTESLTAENTKLTLVVAVDYGGQWDIAQATRKACQAVLDGEMSVDDVDDQYLSSKLVTAEFPDPDLFIRTSGELRISNFYLWQLAYSELYFPDVLWPDFDEVEFDKALEAYANRERRYGSRS